MGKWEEKKEEKKERSSLGEPFPFLTGLRCATNMTDTHTTHNNNLAD